MNMVTQETDKWDERFLELAHHVSQWSKDPSTKVGAIIVDDLRRISGLGYNGLPRGVADDHQRLHDRELKYPMIVHAEANAILNATAPVRGQTLYVTFPPCSECAKLIIQSGIRRVVHSGDDPVRWTDSVGIAKTMMREAGVELRDM